MDAFTPLIPYTLLVLALAGSWWAGYRSRSRRAAPPHTPEAEYFIGLNYLLNDEPDDAIDIFIDALALDSGTLETHLALCTLLRRRGKVDRALAHAEKLLQDPAFSADEQAEIKLNMVRSHVAAGLLDRAERLLVELKQAQQPVREAALDLAITVYQMERDWVQALAAATSLLDTCPPERRAELERQSSHYHCELAESAMSQGDETRAREELKRAAGVDRGNVRSHFLLARIEESRGAWKEAALALQQVARHDPAFACEAVLPLLRVLPRAGMLRERDELLASTLSDSPAHRHFSGLVPLLCEQKGVETTLHLLQTRLRDNPSLALLAETLSLAAGPNTAQGPLLEQGAAVLRQYLHNAPQYRCENCGFELRNLHWLCPGCSRWGQVKPLDSRLPQLQTVRH